MNKQNYILLHKAYQDKNNRIAAGLLDDLEDTAYNELVPSLLRQGYSIDEQGNYNYFYTLTSKGKTTVEEYRRSIRDHRIAVSGLIIAISSFLLAILQFFI